MIKFFYIVAFLILYVQFISCSRSDLIVVAGSMPQELGGDTILIKINGKEVVSERMNKFNISNKYKVRKPKADSVIVSISVPAINFHQDKAVPNSENLFIKFRFGFEDTLVQRHVSFEDLYRLYPDQMKFLFSITYE